MSFHLRAGVSVRTLEKKLVAAARKGAGVVRVPLSDDGEVDAVVTPTVPIALERHHFERVSTRRDGREPAVGWSEFELPE
ncbi:hypothetical protein [Gryllotalpicola daejeonensis]|uniref:hypothetical protein n=1 Tax=Gryllotalpicola daejeonensis TaxID=993087 RepID=UPI0031DA79B5